MSSWLRCAALLAIAACGDNHDAPQDGSAPGDGAALAAPDLRFQWVGTAPAFKQELITTVDYTGGTTATGSTNGGGLGQYVWSPLGMSLDGLVPGNYSWGVTSFSPNETIQPVGSQTYARSIASFDADLSAALASHGGVMTSLDLLSDAYAFVVQYASNATYSVSRANVARSDLDAWVASEATAGRVVTALSASPTASMLRAYSFAKTGDTASYETHVLDATPSSLGSQATALAAAGYVITAVGHVGEDAIVLVGTRAPAAVARTVTVTTGAAASTPDLRDGGAVVAWIYQGASPNFTLVLEQ